MPSDALGARTPVHYFSEAYAVTTTDALVPITGVQRGNAAVATGQLTVATGKILRVERILITGTMGGANIATSSVRLRANLTPGAAALTSPNYWTGRMGSPVGALALHQNLIPVVDVIAEGMEFGAGVGIQFTAQASALTGHVLTFSLLGFEYNA